MESDQHKLFVGGISRETSEEALRQHFSKYGVVLGADVVKEKNTGTSRCFGFVCFSDASSADKALRDTHVILGRRVDVKKAVPKCSQLQIQQRGQQQHYNELQPNNGVHEEASKGNRRTKKIFVGGLSSSITEEEFKNYFERFGRITDVVVIHDSVTNRPRGFGFVTFDSEESVENVMQKNFHDLNNKLVEVKRATPKEGIHNSNWDQDLRFGVGTGSNYENSQSGLYPLDNFGYGMHVCYTPMRSSNGAYPMEVYGCRYPSIAHGPGMLWNNPMMPGTGFYFQPYSNVPSYLAYMNNGFALPGNPVGHNTLAGPKLNRVNDGGKHVNVGEISPQLEGLKWEVSTPVLNKTNGGASSKQNPRGPDGKPLPVDDNDCTLLLSGS